MQRLLHAKWSSELRELPTALHPTSGQILPIRRALACRQRIPSLYSSAPGMMLSPCTPSMMLKAGPIPIPLIIGLIALVPAAPTRHLARLLLAVLEEDRSGKQSLEEKGKRGAGTSVTCVTLEEE